MLGDTILASLAFAARVGVMRVPGAPIVPSDRSVRIVIHLVVAPLFLKMKLPEYVAPGASSSSSPYWAASIAAWRLAPAATRICRSGAGYDVFTLNRGSAAGVADPYEVPVAPLGTGEPDVVVVAESITVMTMERTVVSALA